nr:MAG TPA: hypothetical protein [Caudoviricetes sp.]
MGFFCQSYAFLLFSQNTIVSMALYYKYVVCWSIYSLFCAFFMHKIFL